MLIIDTTTDITPLLEEAARAHRQGGKLHARVAITFSAAQIEFLMGLVSDALDDTEISDADFIVVNDVHELIGDAHDLTNETHLRDYANDMEGEGAL